MKALSLLTLAASMTFGQFPTVEVPADHAKPEGAKISLRVQILKATGENPLPDPLVYLAGGPGGAATDEATGLANAFTELRKTRDIVLIDQRGTGGSVRYDCSLSAGPGRQQPLASPAFPLDLIELCAEGPPPISGAPRGMNASLFTTAQAVEDIALATAALGYGQLNLYGVSYGTRVGLEFLRRHPEQVRTLSLQGVVLPGVPIPVTGTLATQRAIDLLIADCERDAACARNYPDFGKQLAALLGEAGPGQALWNAVVSAALYSSAASSRLPNAVKKAAGGDRSALLDLARSPGSSGGGSLSPGVYLSVVCGEDMPHIQEGDLDRAAATFSGDAVVRGLMRTCLPWPQAETSAELPTAAKPVLLISGEFDPITSPDQAQTAADKLPQSRHVVLKAAGHSGAANECAAGMIAAFIAAADAEGVEASCAESGARPPFYISDVQ